MKNKRMKLYIHASIVYKKRDSAVLITITCEKTRCEKKKTKRVLFLSQSVVPEVKLISVAAFGNQF